MKVLLYDDHILITEAIALYLKSMPNVTHVYQCSTIAKVKKHLEEIEVDLIISDVLSDEDAGITLFDYLANNFPKTKVVVYSSIKNPFIIQSLRDLGVSAIVNKTEPISVLWSTSKMIYESQKIKTNNLKPLLTLTEREKEIANFISKGLSSKEISKTLGTSVNTINNQKTGLIKKFDCTNSTDLVVKLTQMGLLGII